MFDTKLFSTIFNAQTSLIYVFTNGYLHELFVYGTEQTPNDWFQYILFTVSMSYNNKTITGNIKYYV